MRYLQTSAANFRFARAMAEKYAYFDALDYMNALLNMALMKAMEDEDWPLEGGGGPAPPSDLEDDIPF
jgi:hypothetical protein